jgi:DNA-binding MarR family transcriptional regulator
LDRRGEFLLAGIFDGENPAVCRNDNPLRLPAESGMGQQLFVKCSKKLLDIVNDICNYIIMMTKRLLDKTGGLHHTGGESHLLMEIMRTSQTLLGVFTREVGMPSARLALVRLLAVSHPDKLGVTEIARRLGIDAAAVTRQVQEMEAERLIVRHADAKDGRRSSLKLTSKGLRLFEQVHERAHEFERLFGRAVGDEEIATTVKVLKEVRAVIGELCQRERAEDSKW